MKFIHLMLLVLGLSLLAACSSSQNLVTVPPHSTQTINTPAKDCDVALKNNSANDVTVSVINKRSKEEVRGFGLAGQADVFVAKDETLTLANSAHKPLKVQVNFKEPKRPAKTVEAPQAVKYINFTLVNSSSKSIPLIIPTVMNPNLSPKSKSGVGLKVGQKIFFKVKGKRYLLLEVDDSIEEGQKLDVVPLLAQRKKDLGLNN